MTQNLKREFKQMQPQMKLGVQELSQKRTGT